MRDGLLGDRFTPNEARTEAACLYTDMVQARRHALQRWADYFAGG